MTNTWRSSALCGVLFLKSKALVAGTAEHRSVMLGSNSTPALCLSPGSQTQAAGLGRQSEGSKVVCHYCSPTAGPLSEEQLTEHLKAPREITAPTPVTFPGSGPSAAFRHSSKKQNQLQTTFYTLNNSCTLLRTERFWHTVIEKAVFSTVRAFLHAHKHFYMQFYITYARQRSQRKYACPKHLFSFFLLLSISNTTSVDYMSHKKKIPMQFPVLQTGT